MLIIFWPMLEVVGRMCTITPSVVETSKVRDKMRLIKVSKE